MQAHSEHNCDIPGQDTKKVQTERERDRERTFPSMAVIPKEWMGWHKVFTSVPSCIIIWRDGKVIDADVYKIRQLSVLGTNSSAHILHVSNVIFPTAIHQLVKGLCYILLSKLLGRFSQKVNLLWSILHLIESPAMSLSQHQEMWKC